MNQKLLCLIYRDGWSTRQNILEGPIFYLQDKQATAFVKWYLFPSYLQSQSARSILLIVFTKVNILSCPPLLIICRKPKGKTVFYNSNLRSKVSCDISTGGTGTIYASCPCRASAMLFRDGPVPAHRAGPSEHLYRATRRV